MCVFTLFKRISEYFTLCADCLPFLVEEALPKTKRVGRLRAHCRRMGRGFVGGFVRVRPLRSGATSDSCVSPLSLSSPARPSAGLALSSSLRIRLY
jgi:hypothetical protein